MDMTILKVHNTVIAQKDVEMVFWKLIFMNNAMTEIMIMATDALQAVSLRPITIATQFTLMMLEI